MKMGENRHFNGWRELRKEWVAALFGLLMATALPALVALRLAPAEGGRSRAPGEDSPVLLCRHGGQAEECLPLERILVLSLAATNSSDVPAASLAAQAVVLRSRAVWWMDYCGDFSGEAKESDEEREVHTLCDSPSHGLPFRSEEELISLLGRAETVDRMQVAEAAVRQTRGQVLTYEGEVIPAMLHTASGGMTRSVESLAWTRSVTTPETAAVTVWRIDAEDARAALAAEFGLRLSDDPADWGIETVETEGIVSVVRVEEREISATVFAAALGLPSGDLAVETLKGALVITCTGQGSGCGLSRAGAAIYAEGGLSYGEILAHYFPDCKIGRVWE